MRFAARPIVLALAFALLPATALHAQEFSSIEERMTGAQYREAGLDKLSNEELAALNRWIRENIAGTATAPAPATADRRGFMEPIEDGEIRSTIPGEFRGWRGSGVRITLENGMVWETTDPASVLSVRLVDPEVRVRQGFGGAWFLRVDGYNTQVRVRRVQ
ncbi:MAG: hypothetical protein ACXIUZ_13765 [Lysobacteraceae bacterium]|mgnify:CR=1 FL=1